MTKQEIIDALDVAKRMQLLMELLPEKLIEAHKQMSAAVLEIICDVIDADDALDIILLALKTQDESVRVRTLIDTNEQLQIELKEARLKNQALMDELQQYKKQALAAEDDETGDEAPEKRKHRWTTEENRWIAEHLNSVTDREVAERFGVSQKAAMSQMQRIKHQLGKS